jgi:hypothetical protein
MTIRFFFILHWKIFIKQTIANQRESLKTCGQSYMIIARCGYIGTQPTCAGVPSQLEQIKLITTHPEIDIGSLQACASWETMQHEQQDGRLVVTRVHN